jgi:hypothetical protein
MIQSKVWTFFYGSYINLNVLSEVDLVPEHHEIARLHGFDIQIRPLANLTRSDQHCAYGILTTTTHNELKRLYTHAEHILGGVYLPEAVLTMTMDHKMRPALCYIAPSMDPKPADNNYIDRIIEPAKAYGFPAWYIEKLERFRP